VPNGVDLTAYTPGEKPADLQEKWNLRGKFVAAYVGTIGMAHGLGTVLAAAEQLRARDDIAFLLVGTGAEEAALAARCRERGLTNVIFAGAVSKAEVREYWKLCDVALVLLRDSPLFAHVIPSKMFEAMGMERPMILGVRGESRAIVEASQAGIPVTPEQAGELVQAIVRLADDAELRKRLGRAGRDYAAREFNRDRLAHDMLEVLEGTAAQG
jgi:glycosyltransferase involved in cell wall biosynthesis